MQAGGGRATLFRGALRIDSVLSPIRAHLPPKMRAKCKEDSPVNPEVPCATDAGPGMFPFPAQRIVFLQVIPVHLLLKMFAKRRVGAPVSPEVPRADVAGLGIPNPDAAQRIVFLLTHAHLLLKMFAKCREGSPVSPEVPRAAAAFQDIHHPGFLPQEIAILLPRTDGNRPVCVQHQ